MAQKAWNGVVAFAAAAEAKKPDADQPAAKSPDDHAAKAADESASRADLGEGALVRVRLPISGNADEHLKSVIKRVVDQLTKQPQHANRRPTLILELVPQQSGGDGKGSDFTRALSLANYLTQPDLAAVKTVAYIPRTIKGHGVLIALACEEIVMNAEAEIGDAAVDEDASRADRIQRSSARIAT